MNLKKLTNTVERLTPDLDCSSPVCQEHIARYKFCVPHIKNKKVLDIACGNGYGSNLMAISGAAQVVGGDISAGTIELARETYRGRNIHFYRMDARSIPYENQYFDVVVSMETIEHLSDYQFFLNEICRVLKNGGELILSTPNREATQSLGIRNPYHKREFILDELLNLLPPFFTDFQVFGQQSVKIKNYFQNLLTSLHLAINKIAPLGVLRDFLPLKLRRSFGRRVDGLNSNYGLEPFDRSKQYLYLIIHCRKKVS